MLHLDLDGRQGPSAHFAASLAMVRHRVGGNNPRGHRPGTPPIEGHTGHAVSTCVRDAVDAYLSDRTVPATGVGCSR